MGSSLGSQAIIHAAADTRVQIVGEGSCVTHDAVSICRGALAEASVLVVPAYPLHREFEAPPRRGLGALGRGIGWRGSATAGSQVVRIPGLQARPLGGGTSIGTDTLLACKPLWPAGRRVLLRLLPPVDGQVEQDIAVIHRLDAAARSPVSLETMYILPTRRPTKRVSSES